MSSIDPSSSSNPRIAEHNPKPSEPSMDDPSKEAFEILAAAQHHVKSPWGNYVQERSPTWLSGILSSIGFKKSFFHGMERDLDLLAEQMASLETDHADIQDQIEERFRDNAQSMVTVSLSETDSVSCVKQFQLDHLGRWTAALVIHNESETPAIFKYEDADEATFKQKLMAIKELCRDNPAALALLQNCLCQFTLIKLYGGDVLPTLNMWRADLSGSLEIQQSTYIEERDRKIIISPKMDEMGTLVGFEILSEANIDLYAKEEEASGSNTRRIATISVKGSFVAELTEDSFKVSDFERYISPLKRTDDEAQFLPAD